MAGVLKTSNSDRAVRLCHTSAGEETSRQLGDGLVARHMVIAYGSLVAVRDVDIDLPGGTVTVLMGRNGSGKSSLLWALTGVGTCQGGTWAVDGAALKSMGIDAIRRHIRLVPQSAADLLYLDSVGAECAQADAQNHREAGTCRAMLDALAPGVDDATHPRDLSEGQKLALAVSVQLCGDPDVLLLDEPTRGLDYPAKAALCQMLRALSARGTAVCVVTHDVEFAAQVADRAVVMAGGEVIQTGPGGEVRAGSAAFATQVAKVMAPQPWLTVAQVAAGRASPAERGETAPHPEGEVMP
jgi:energy-coupling factor transport system ATP-binding protein